MRTGALLAIVAALAAYPYDASARAACVDDIAHAAVREQASYVSGTATVRGLIYRPARPNGAGVVLQHGARGLGEDAATFDPHAVQLASRGYHVLVPNYYEAAPGRPERSSSDMRVWRAAAADGAAWLASRPGMQAGRTALWGYSLGGFLAGETAMGAGAVASGVSVAGGLDVGPAGRERREVPLLLIHARRDTVISPSSTRQWAQSLRRRGATVEVQGLTWEGHGLNAATWCDVFGRTRAFLDRTLTVTQAGESFTAGDPA